MQLLLKLTKVLGLALAILLSVVTVIYILLLIINLQDETPSAAALTMQALQQPVADMNADNNGYLYFHQHAGSAEHLVSEDFSLLMRQCDVSDCHAVLMAQPQLAQLVEQHRALADFYQQVRSYSHWYEPIPVDTAEAMPSYQSLLHAQQLLLLQAWLAVQQQDMVTAQHVLKQDLHFWRSQLQRNNLLLSKMISTAAVKRHLRFATVLKQQIAPQQQAAMMPQSWLAPFTAEELSMLRAFSGEWVFGNNVIQTVLQPAADATESSATERLSLMLLKPLLLIQATSNERARMLLAQADGDIAPTPPWYSWLYNPLGKLLNSLGTEQYIIYRQRSEELELLRQQAIAVD
ncbi:hypothetical protein [Rheinheimera sp. NSM]|uniref:hypothetical protein n=1 Tax=Rheinheimera sp. NSM TaxID=3457884 RepID=UPI0040350395